MEQSVALPTVGKPPPKCFSPGCAWKEVSFGGWEERETTSHWVRISFSLLFPLTPSLLPLYSFLLNCGCFLKWIWGSFHSPFQNKTYHITCIASSKLKNAGTWAMIHLTLNAEFILLYGCSLGFLLCSWNLLSIKQSPRAQVSLLHRRDTQPAPGLRLDWSLFSTLEFLPNCFVIVWEGIQVHNTLWLRGSRYSSFLIPRFPKTSCYENCIHQIIHQTNRKPRLLGFR